jgi:hypothetical protein
MHYDTILCKNKIDLAIQLLNFYYDSEATQKAHTIHA